MTSSTHILEKRLPLTSDYVFRRIFGQEENKGALIDFLESILNISIHDIKINNPELPKDFSDSKYGVLDLKVTLNDDTIVNVEMQVQNQHNIEQRSAWYLSNTYANQLSESEPYLKCKKVIVINILNFKYYKRNSYHSIARMKFEESMEDEKINLGYNLEDQYATNYLEMHVIELPKFKQKNPEVGTKLEQWLWLFVGGEDKVKEASKFNKEIERINKKLASMSLSREERNNYEFRLKSIRDEISAIAYATEKGLTQGIKEGREKGLQEGIKEGIKEGIQKGIQKEKRNTIKKLLEKNFSIEEIEEITGINKKEIKKISKD